MSESSNTTPVETYEGISRSDFLANGGSPQVWDKVTSQSAAPSQTPSGAVEQMPLLVETGHTFNTDTALQMAEALRAAGVDEAKIEAALLADGHQVEPETRS